MKASKPYSSPTQISEATRAKLIPTYNQLLLDSIDLHSQLKVAHWNIKGPHFVSLHPFFDTMATELAVHIDALAERTVLLGGQIQGTARSVARESRLADYDEKAVKDLEHARLLAERIEAYLKGVESARVLGGELGDEDTVDTLTQLSGAFSKHAWFLRATLG